MGGGRTLRSGGAQNESVCDMHICCQNIITSIRERNELNFLALDFDLTLVDVHTHGRWKESELELAKRIRPFFREFIPLAVQHGIHLAVVTFSEQAAMIRQVLLAAFGECARNIVIRASDNSWKYDGRGCAEGKQAHIASAVEELISRNRSQSITRATTLLIDDDLYNVDVALSQGVRAIWCDPDTSKMLKDLQAVALGEVHIEQCGADSKRS